jgi:hypothetical protein
LNERSKPFLKVKKMLLAQKVDKMQAAELKGLTLKN